MIWHETREHLRITFWTNVSVLETFWNFWIRKMVKLLKNLSFCQGTGAMRNRPWSKHFRQHSVSKTQNTTHFNNFLVVTINDRRSNHRSCGSLLNSTRSSRLGNDTGEVEALLSAAARTRSARSYQCFHTSGWSVGMSHFSRRRNWWWWWWWWWWWGGLVQVVADMNCFWISSSKEENCLHLICLQEANICKSVVEDQCHRLKEMKHQR